MSKISLCSNWEFTKEWNEEFLSFQGQQEKVRLPHTVSFTPVHYADHRDYQMICGYRRKLFVPEQGKNRRLFLQFDGAAHIATLYVNGQEVSSWYDGYTAFRAEITQYVEFGKENQVAVRLDTTENPAIPPFGHVIDYLTYGGLYREAWLDIREESFLADVFVTTPQLDLVHAEVKVDNPDASGLVQVQLLDREGNLVAQKCQGIGKAFDLDVDNSHPWSPDDPYLYSCKVELMEEDGRVMDRQELSVGIRTVEFKADGFYLNGEKTFIRGLDRHQCYPYMGYAVPARLQREDARILRKELGCNAVRTSHYPQSQHFIDECDRLGLLVFTEIPGWQHIGDESWQDFAVENVRHMVTQYRNHPSIILWGVRINESQDCDSFYSRTNALAHQLDPSRPTSGVRCIRQSSLLEDVYAYNDFSHVGNNPGVRLKKDVTPDMEKALLVTEYGGHMFPTKSYDPWAKRQEHALRHATVISAAANSGEHAGTIGWCMFDYPTHKEFGSGDRVCYHGVLDSYRNPKLAAAVYASQQEQTPVLELASSMDIGDYPGGEMGKLYVFTNAEEVDVYRNQEFVATLTPSSRWSGLRHGPMTMEDIIGKQLENKENMSAQTAAVVLQVLNEMQAVGLAELTPGDQTRLKNVLRSVGVAWEEGVKLYKKYVRSWGTSSDVWRLDGRRGEQVIASRTYSPSAKLHLEVSVSHNDLVERDTYDVAAVRIRLVNENDCAAPFAQIPVYLNLEGPGELVGPSVVVAEGGMCGTYVRTRGEKGNMRLTISTDQTESVVVGFTVDVQE